MSELPVQQPSKAALWIGYVLTALPAALLTVSAVMKITQNEMAVEGFAKTGWPDNVLVPLGIVELACVVIYLFPRTAVLGAILITGYLGGAIATHVHQGEPFIGPAAFGVIAWIALYLREPRLRALAPWRS